VADDDVPPAHDLYDGDIDDADSVVTGEHPTVPSEPWAGYDELSIKKIKKHVRHGVSEAHPKASWLTEIREYEVANKNRASLITELDELIDRA
jgi:hypothetical protein